MTLMPGGKPEMSCLPVQFTCCSCACTGTRKD